MLLINDLAPELAERLQVLIDVIASENGVRKVILFGSTATGRRHKDSDIDILVLVESAMTDSIDLITSIRMRSFDVVSFPLDILVETERDFEERSVLPTLERKIAREGMVLYAA
jgi:predicted nucleotidyltransferase